jgi:pimeloyl-ACP methyl ester carboxylesterase
VRVAAAVLALGGAALARTPEPEIQVERLTIVAPDGAELPALRIAREPGHGPRALLAHGLSASKETLVHVAEALAAAGFDCLLIDFPGHGENRARFSRHSDLGATLVQGASFLAPGRTSVPEVDVLVGHSMGAFVGGHALAQGRLRTKLFLAYGALPELGPSPTVLLAGALEELHPPDAVRAAAAAARAAGFPVTFVISPTADHMLEPFDPSLTAAAVKAACEAAGLREPVPPSRWQLRLAGALVLAIALAAFVFVSLPDGRASSRLASLRAGTLVGGTALVALVVGLGGTWLGAAPTRSHLPAQGILALAVFALSVATTRLAALVPAFRAAPATVAAGVVAALAAFGTLGAVADGDRLLALMAGLATLILLSAALLAAFVEARTRSPWGAHAALALWLGYVLGGWVPVVY